jgi:2-dehydropantoate 2-reductase
MCLSARPRFNGGMPWTIPNLLLHDKPVSLASRCEVDAINGAIPRLGKPLGVITPVNDALVGIIRARERRMLA